MQICLAFCRQRSDSCRHRDDYGTIGKKMGLTVTSTKGEDGERSYSIKP
jgi:hypothetical protein